MVFSPGGTAKASAVLTAQLTACVKGGHGGQMFDNVSGLLM